MFKRQIVLPYLNKKNSFECYTNSSGFCFIATILFLSQLQKIFYFYNYQYRRMGCESSNDSLNIKPPSPKDNQTTNQDQDDDNSVIKAGRGEMFELYRFSKVIFRSSAIIRHVIDHKSDILRICKILPINSMGNLLRAHQQLEILRNLSHPNIVQLIQSFSQNNFLYIILENIPGKSLNQYLSDRQLLHFPVMLEVIRQILAAIKFCHEMGFVHRGINMENIMLVKLGEGKGYQVKVVGFGQALRIGARPLGGHNQTKSSLSFPSGVQVEEMIEKQDIWGCGVIFLQVISGQRTFQNFKQRKNEIIESIAKKQDCSDDFKEVIKDFLCKMLEGSSKKRFTVHEALSHKIFNHSFSNSIRVKRNSANDIEKWLNFNIKSTLNALTSMHHSLTVDKQSQNAQQLIQFYHLDKNKVGKINFQEFVRGIQNTFSMEQAIAEEHAAKAYCLMNKDNSDYLQLSEYIEAIALVSRVVYKKSLLKIFTQLDTNRDGKISLKEFKNSIEGMSSSISLKKYENDSLVYDQYKELMLNFFKEQKSDKEK